MITQTYTTAGGDAFDIEIAPAPADGKKYPIVVLIHGNFGLAEPFGKPLREFTQEIGNLGYVAALPSYFAGGAPDPTETNIAPHVPALEAAIKHLSARPDADPTRLGLVGFSLGGGIAMAFITGSAKNTVTVFADFFGLLPPSLATPAPDVSDFPPTIAFNNANDPLVGVDANSRPFTRALKEAKIDYEYHEYHDDWSVGLNHVFLPGGPADVDSRAHTKSWLAKYMPPSGK